MIAGLHYTKDAVVSAFLQSSGTLAPSEADLSQFDADMFASRDAALVANMNALAIPVDVPTKSRIFQYSFSFNGTVEEAARLACRYHLNTVNL